MTERGLFITLEGIEGVGKSTQLEHVSGWFRRRGRAVVMTREPGGTRTGEAIRQILLRHDNVPLCPEAELLLMFAARAQHLVEVIRPALAAGQVVISDRFTDASYAYQGGGRGIDPQQITGLAQWVQAGLHPDLTLLLDAPAEVGLRRAQRRSQADRFEAEAVAFFQRARQVYLDIAQREPERVVVVDACPDVVEVADVITAVLERRYA